MQDYTEIYIHKYISFYNLKLKSKTHRLNKTFENCERSGKSSYATVRFITSLIQISEHTQTCSHCTYVYAYPNCLQLLIAQIIEYFSFIRFISAAFAFQHNLHLCTYVCTYVFMYSHNYSAAKFSLKLRRKNTIIVVKFYPH